MLSKLSVITVFSSVLCWSDTPEFLCCVDSLTAMSNNLSDYRFFLGSFRLIVLGQSLSVLPDPFGDHLMQTFFAACLEEYTFLYPKPYSLAKKQKRQLDKETAWEERHCLAKRVGIWLENSQKSLPNYKNKRCTTLRACGGT